MCGTRHQRKRIPITSIKSLLLSLNLAFSLGINDINSSNVIEDLQLKHSAILVELYVFLVGQFSSVEDILRVFEIVSCQNVVDSRIVFVVFHDLQIQFFNFIADFFDFFRLLNLSSSDCYPHLPHRH